MQVANPYLPTPPLLIFSASGATDSSDGPDGRQGTAVYIAVAGRCGINSAARQDRRYGNGLRPAAGDAACEYPGPPSGE